MSAKIFLDLTKFLQIFATFSGVASSPALGGKNIVALPPTKTTEFEVKIGAKERKKQKQK